MATMSVASAPTATKPNSSSDKLDLLQSRLNSLQENLTTLDMGKDTKEIAHVNGDNRDEQVNASSPVNGSGNSLLARIKAAQEQQQNNEAKAKVESSIVSNENKMYSKEANFSGLTVKEESQHILKGQVTKEIPSPTPIQNNNVEAKSLSLDDLNILESDSNMKPSSDVGIDQGNQPATRLASPNEETDAFIEGEEKISFEDENLDEEILEEQRRILESIEADRQSKNLAMKLLVDEKKAMRAESSSGAEENTEGHNFVRQHGVQDASMPNAATEANSSNSDTNANTNVNNIVDIGQGKKVKLFSQDKTLEAIADGSAKLVQCMNCLAKLKVTRDATLIFCPYCSSISPIMNAEIGNSQEEADYKLALKLQKEEDAAAESAQNDTAEVGWAEWIGNKVGYSSPTKDSNSSSTVNTRQNTDQNRAATGYTNPNNGEARVAPSSGYFSCVVDSVSNLTTSTYDLATSYSGDDLAFASNLSP